MLVEWLALTQKSPLVSQNATAPHPTVDHETRFYDSAALVAGDERMWNASPNRDRLEIPLESPLADKLRELGYDLIFCERATRIGGSATPAYDARWRNGAVTSGYGFRTVDVYLIRPPK